MTEERWATGAARYEINASVGELGHGADEPLTRNIGTAVYVEVGGDPIRALLDSGCAHSAIALSATGLSEADVAARSLRKSSLWIGGKHVTGHVVPLGVTVLAEWGEEVCVEARFLVHDGENSAPAVVLGQIGFLELLRVALVPSMINDEHVLYFAEAWDAAREDEPEVPDPRLLP